MERRPSGAAGAAGTAEEGPLVDDLTDRNENRAHVAVTRGDAVAVVDLDHVAITARIAGCDDGTAGGGADRKSDRRPEIDAGVYRGALEERIDARAEPAGDHGARKRAGE